MSNHNDKIDAKKAAVLGGKKNNRVPLLLMVACAVLVIGGGVLFMGQAKDQAPPLAQVFQPEAAATELTYPVAEFDDGTARFFMHRTGDGVTIRFFVLKSSDGVIRSAFDACDSCWRSHKGYRQDGDEMVCNNCRQRFASVKVMEVKGGCNPSPLPNRIEDGRVVVQVADVEAGRSYFEVRPARQEG